VLTIWLFYYFPLKVSYKDKIILILQRCKLPVGQTSSALEIELANLPSGKKMRLRKLK